MEDVAELPRPVFCRVGVIVLVEGVDPPQEVDELVPRGAVRDAELGIRDGAVALVERREAPGADRGAAAHRGSHARDGLDRPAPRRYAVQHRAGFPDRTVDRFSYVRPRGIHRDQAVGVALVGLEEALPEGAGLVGLEGRQIGLGASRRAGRRNDWSRKGKGGGEDAADLSLEHLLQLGRVLRFEEKAAAVLGSVLQDVVGPDRKSTRLNSSHSQISYAVFCLKKKTTNIATRTY